MRDAVKSGICHSHSRVRGLFVNNQDIYGKSQKTEQN